MLKNGFGIHLGKMQKKTIAFVLILIAAVVLFFAMVFLYHSKMLTGIVEDTRVQQQEAISQVTSETMHQVVAGTLVNSTSMQAQIADSDFAEVISDTRMLQTMAQGILESKGLLAPVEVYPPDPAKDGTPSAQVLCEEGVDYTQSEYIGLVGHLTSPMIAMYSNSEKVKGCFIGLCDGTHLGVDINSRNRFDENGNLKPFPVRQRPWYVGAAETGRLFFTGVEKDAFSGELCVTCSAPVVVDGETLGVVGVDIVMESMDNFVNASTDNGYSFTYIVNDQGQMILAPSGSSFSAATAARIQALQDAGDEDLNALTRSALREITPLSVMTIDGKEYYLAGAPMPSVGWAVISVLDKERTELPEKQMLAVYDGINDTASAGFRAGIGKIRQNVTAMLILLFAAGGIIGAYGANRTVKPIEKMTENIIESGKTGKLFEMQDIYRTGDEIQVLAEAFDDLSKKTKQYIEDITQITREKERVSTELQMANQIQNSMLPHIFPAFPTRPEFDIYAAMDPAKEVGGDFYDFFLIDDDHLCMVMADVSGKGIPAALFMMASKIILQSCAMLGKDPADILALTNEAICSNNQEQMFVTVWLGILEISTGKVTAANAGHEYPAIMKDGKFSLLKDKHGMVIGGIDGTRYTEYEIQLDPGDKLFLYTDGVPEATDAQQQMFGTTRMLEALNASAGDTPEQLLKDVRYAVDAFVCGAEQFDDLTMLCVERKKAAAKAETPAEKTAPAEE